MANSIRQYLDHVRQLKAQQEAVYGPGSPQAEAVFPTFTDDTSMAEGWSNPDKLAKRPGGFYHMGNMQSYEAAGVAKPQDRTGYNVGGKQYGNDPRIMNMPGQAEQGPRPQPQSFSNPQAQPQAQPQEQGAIPAQQQRQRSDVDILKMNPQDLIREEFQKDLPKLWQMTMGRYGKNVGPKEMQTWQKVAMDYHNNLAKSIDNMIGEKRKVARLGGELDEDRLIKYALDHSEKTGAPVQEAVQRVMEVAGHVRQQVRGGIGGVPGREQPETGGIPGKPAAPEKKPIIGGDMRREQQLAVLRKEAESGTPLGKSAMQLLEHYKKQGLDKNAAFARVVDAYKDKPTDANGRPQGFSWPVGSGTAPYVEEEGGEKRLEGEVRQKPVSRGESLGIPTRSSSARSAAKAAQNY
jgi:hypothetical protein